MNLQRTLEEEVGLRKKMGEISRRQIGELEDKLKVSNHALKKATEHNVS